MKRIEALISLLIELMYEFKNTYFNTTEVKNCTNTNDFLTLIHDAIISTIMYKDEQIYNNKFFEKVIYLFCNELKTYYLINPNKLTELLQTYHLLQIMFDYSNDFDRPAINFMKAYFIHLDLEMHIDKPKIEYYEHEIKELIRHYCEYNCD